MYRRWAVVAVTGGGDGRLRTAVALEGEWLRVGGEVEGEVDWASLDGRRVAARRRWRDGGGRKRLAWLRRWEADEGRAADSRGRWRVARVLGVERPAGRRGLQLNVLVEWAGVDVETGNRWGAEWVPVTWCTGDVRAEARRMEAVQYGQAGRRAAEPPAGCRKSPRLADAAAGETCVECDEEGEEGDDDGGELRPAREAAGSRTTEEAEDGGSEAEVDDLVEMLRARRRRDAEDEAMRGRVAAEVEARMDNGVRINPVLRVMAGGAAAREVVEGERAATAVDARRRCPAGHELRRARGGAAGLVCDGACAMPIRRGLMWWSCEACDFDMCMACCDTMVA